MITVPDVVAAKARDVGAHDWLRDLGDLVTEAASMWGLTVGEPIPGGTEAYVCRVSRKDGSAAVLKMMIPRSSDGLGGRAAALEASVLRLAGGDGCVELFASDDTLGALLVEQLGPSLFDLGLPIEQQHQIMTTCAQSLWRPAPDLDLPSGAEKARWLIESVTRQWEALDRPCTEAAVVHAIECAQRREAAHDDERGVLVHGDIHQWNTLRTLSGHGYKLIDPDGLRAEPEYDLGIFMREDPLELMTGDPFARAEKLAAMTGLDPIAIWEWGAIERVSTGLLCVGIGLEPVGSQMLAAAERLAGM